MESMIFVGDNGMVTCFKHSGYSIRKTGRDLSGDKALALTAEEAQEIGAKCECCKAQKAA
jgi:hypothetical protein